MAVTTTTQVDPEVTRYFDNILLDRRKPNFIHMIGAQVRRLPQKNSDTVIFRRFDNLSDALTPLSEGVTPNSEQVSKFDITAVTSQYGKVVELSDKVVITVQDDTSNEVADMLSQNMNSTLDKIVRNMLNATASQIACANGVNGGTPTELTQTDIDVAIDFLEGNNGVKFTPTLEGMDRFGTAPIWQSYWGLLHSDLRSDVKAVSSFLSRNQYPDPKEALQSELGSTDEVRWLMSSEVFESSGTYNNVMFGQNAYARIAIDDLASEFIIKPLGHGEDRLNQRQSMGWKSFFASVILDDGWVVNLQSTAA
jgi:N4-gp56 family major capsid protein